MARILSMLFRLPNLLCFQKKVTRLSQINLFKLKQLLKIQKKTDKEELRTLQPLTKEKDKITKQVDLTCATEYFKMRIQWVKELKETGKNPYPHKFNVSISLPLFVDKYRSLDHGQMLKDKNVSVAGRIYTKRELGRKLIFYDLKGEGAKIQVMADADNYFSEEKFLEINSAIQRGDTIGCRGHPYKTKTGELSIVPTHIEILTPCLRMLPHPHYGLKDKETRFRQRYLDFILNDSTRQRIILRAKIYKYIRNFLDNLDFIEVDTPIMHNEPGGAAAKPFITHHHFLNSDLYLRIAPELKLKEILAGPINRIYEIGRQFRNEGVDSTHNPEFTTCEFYAAFKDYNYIMKLTETLISEIVISVHDTHKILYYSEGQQFEIDFCPPFKKIKLLPALEEAMGEKLPEPFELHLPEANKRLSFLCTKYNVECVPPKTSKRLLDKLVGHFLEKTFINPTFLCDYPEILSPLAKCHPNVRGLTERCELFVMKTEIVNAYTEENDPFVIRQRFNYQAEEKAAGDNEAQLIDENFCRALEYGLKPCAGGGIGIDRLLMILANTNSIKEVLSFPAMRQE